MCYPQPGPRCASHLPAKIKAAEKAGDTKQVRVLKAELSITPPEQKKLEKEIRLLENAPLPLTPQASQKDIAEAARIRAEQIEQMRTKLARKETAWNMRLRAFKQSRLAIASDPSTPTPKLTAMVESNDEPKEARLLAVETLRKQHTFYAAFTKAQLAQLFGLTPPADWRKEDLTLRIAATKPSANEGATV